MPKSRRKIALLIVAVTGIVVMGVILWPGLSNYCRKQGMVWMLTWSVEEWNGWRGRGTEIDLTGVDLSGADLGNADLHSVNLSGPDLSWAYLDDADRWALGASFRNRP